MLALATQGQRERAVDERSYLIRYGVMSHVGRFPVPSIPERSLIRGQLVVLQTDRGVEMGEVLIATESQSIVDDAEVHADATRTAAEDPSSAISSTRPRVLRVAEPDDLLRWRDATESRLSRFSLCKRILRDGNWPWELIDVEPLLDGRSTVIHYLGPHHVDVATLRARFRVECDIEIVLEPVGADLDGESDEPAHTEENEVGGCGSCGSSGGGCCETTSPRNLPVTTMMGPNQSDMGARPRLPTPAVPRAESANCWQIIRKSGTESPGPISDELQASRSRQFARAVATPVKRRRRSFAGSGLCSSNASMAGRIWSKIGSWAYLSLYKGWATNAR